MVVKFECGEMIRIKVNRNEQQIGWMITKMVYIYIKYFLPLRLGGQNIDKIKPLDDEEVEKIRERFFEHLNFNLTA